MTDSKPPSSVLRQRFAEEYLLPLARALFELEPRCQSVLVTLGQYWCDEAADAVHSEVIACEERDPVWPSAGQARPGRIGDAEALAEVLDAAPQPDDEPESIAVFQIALLEEAHQRAFGERYFSVLDDNTDMIVAFASYCLEVSDQEQPSWRSHTPYGLVRRPLGGEPLAVEVVGRMHRPQWEDRWDVLETDGLISEADVAPRQPHVTRAELDALRAAPRSPTGIPPWAGLRPALLFLIVVAAIVSARACLDR